MDYLSKDKFLVIDNFFDDFEYILPTLKAYPQWNKDEHPQAGAAGTWPGKRSMNLMEVDPAMGAVFMMQARPYLQRNASIDLFTHLRLDSDNAEDGIHTDAPFALSCLVYLSETNYSSGTVFYTGNPALGGEPMAHVGFKQNRAVFFSAHMHHGSINNFGDSKENGRLTLNMFSLAKKRGGCDCG